jgi:DNA-binding MarR family transcriptional regulator
MESDISNGGDLPGSPTEQLDDVVHQRVRLGILTIAHESRRVEFLFLRDALGVTAGNLSQHIRVLEEAGLVTVAKGSQGRRPRTWVSITRPGRSALRREVASLKELVDRVQGASERPR